MEKRIPSDSGFVVEWQLVEDAGPVIDLSMAEGRVGDQDPLAGELPGRVPVPR